MIYDQLRVLCFIELKLASYKKYKANKAKQDTNKTSQVMDPSHLVLPD